AKPAHAAAVHDGELLLRRILRIDDRDAPATALKRVQRIERCRIVGAVEARLHHHEAVDAARRAERLQCLDAGDAGQISPLRPLRILLYGPDDMDVAIAAHRSPPRSAAATAAAARRAAAG